MCKDILTRLVAFVMLTAGTLLTTAPIAQAKLTAEQQCQKSRYDAAAKSAQCLNKALGQHFAVNDLAKLQPALSKCHVKYTDIWVKLQKKAVGTGSTCDAPRFVDNGERKYFLSRQRRRYRAEPNHRHVMLRKCPM